MIIVIELPAISIRTLVLLTGLLISLSIVCQGWTAESDETRVEKILGQMDLQEKLDYLGGGKAMSNRPRPRLGVPETRMSDGPLGVRRGTPRNHYPAGGGRAASRERAPASVDSR